LVFEFPEVHPQARLALDFRRTLRIPDDGGDYPLPPGLGSFPLRLVDDFAERVPPQWLQHGGLMLPMYQSEALGLNFAGVWGDKSQYPFAVKVAAGRVNAVTGGPWEERLRRRPQDYVVVPEQPWLDGFAAEKGIRQFIATPLSRAYSAEEQFGDRAEIGGLRLIVYPMKSAVFERRFPKVRRGVRYRMETAEHIFPVPAAPARSRSPRGRGRQDIFEDPFAFDDWDLEHSGRCFVHLANSLVWRVVTGTAPPTVPPSAAQYSTAQLPWLDHYGDDSRALEGASELTGLDSLPTFQEGERDEPLGGRQSVTTERIVELRKGLEPGHVREGDF
jgi:hypothetical protein